MLDRRRFCTAALFAGQSVLVPPRPDIVFADFEGATYAPWRVEGAAFGSGPAPGTLPGQMPVTGFAGRGLVNSYHNGDGATGRLVSPDFAIARDYITFLIGGGGWAGQTCLNLVVDGRIVCTATGPNTRPGGRERLARTGWDVREVRGRIAHLEIVDSATGGWGHITVDDITFTDTKPTGAAAPRHTLTRRFALTHRWLQFPVANAGQVRRVRLHVGGQVVRAFDVALAEDGSPDWFAPTDVSLWRGQELTVAVDDLPDGSPLLAGIVQGDTLAGRDPLYGEALRPQFHFSARRGWLNDPNGLVYRDGEYHLFFQHCPFSVGDGVKYWGHAVSRDLVHWQELGEALEPDALGPMWSGSAVVDWANTSGFGQGGKPPLVLIYTAAGEPFTQCIAYSRDGRTVTKYARNPVVANITGGNRDPRVFWHAPTQKWVQALYVSEGGNHTIHFLTSPNLQDWTAASVMRGTPGTNFLYECPDIFALPLDGDPARLRWVLMGANTEYVVGDFDGTTFHAQTPPQPGHQGRGFYAPQTVSDAPNHRRIQIGWWQTNTPGMPFNQSMSLPLDLGLISTPGGPRLTWTPVRELEALRAAPHDAGQRAIDGNHRFPLPPGDGVELRAEWTPGPAPASVAFSVRGLSVVYDTGKQQVTVGDLVAPAPLRGGRARLCIFADRTGLEVFASDGLTFVPLPHNLTAGDTSVVVSTEGGPVTFDRLVGYALKSIWR